MQTKAGHQGLFNHSSPEITSYIFTYHILHFSYMAIKLFPHKEQFMAWLVPHICTLCMF